MSGWPSWISFQPIIVWPGTLAQFRESSPFSVKRDQTIRELRSELDFLGADDVVLRVALAPSDIRRDGHPRAGAQPVHPGIVLVFAREPSSKKFGTPSQALSYLQQMASSTERDPHRLFKLASVRGAHPDVGGTRATWDKIAEAHRYLTDEEVFEIGVDKFITWTANLRALTLALHDLRRLKRYGVAQDDQHLAGFRAALTQGKAS